jgi:hypothetical protein
VGASFVEELSMKKLSLPLCLVAAATLSACSTTQVTQTPFIQPAEYVSPVPNTPVRAGVGKVVVLTDPTGPVNALTWQRMTLKMDSDNSFQTVDRRGHQVANGETVRVQ